MKLDEYITKCLLDVASNGPSKALAAELKGRKNSKTRESIVTKFVRNRATELFVSNCMERSGQPYDVHLLVVKLEPDTYYVVDDKRAVHAAPGTRFDTGQLFAAIDDLMASRAVAVVKIIHPDHYE